MIRQLEIIDNGIDAKVMLDGKLVPGVRHYSISHGSNEMAEIDVETYGGTMNFVAMVTQTKPDVKVLARLDILDVLKKHYWKTTTGTEYVCACEQFRIHARLTGAPVRSELQDAMALHVTRMLTGNGKESESFAVQQEGLEDDIEDDWRPSLGGDDPGFDDRTIGGN